MRWKDDFGPPLPSQKNNCLGLSAEPPALPDVQPMARFQGKQLSHDLAERIFIGAPLFNKELLV